MTAFLFCGTNPTNLGYSFSSPQFSTIQTPNKMLIIKDTQHYLGLTACLVQRNPNSFPLLFFWPHPFPCLVERILKTERIENGLGLNCKSLLKAKICNSDTLPQLNTQEKMKLSLIIYENYSPYPKHDSFIVSLLLFVFSSSPTKIMVTLDPSLSLFLLFIFLGYSFFLTAHLKQPGLFFFSHFLFIC